MNNPIGLDGIDFVEYSSPYPEKVETLFYHLGFNKIGTHKTKDIHLFHQGDIYFISNNEPNSFAENFAKAHGPSICSVGFRVQNANHAFQETVKRGAKPYEGETKYPAIYGIGDSLIYFIEKYGEKTIFKDDFNVRGNSQSKTGFLVVDHLTNNVPAGQMQRWCDFYEKLFNFREVRYFEIKGEKTGLISKVMQSPDNKIIIPINEPTDEKSQIQEYIDEYNGSGIQHLALLTNDICHSVSAVRENKIQFLDVPDTYYETLPQRVPQLTENLKTLQDLRILADGDEKGYLLQIFTQNVIGPIFFEIIQRKNNDGFGEGNFQALFDAIERDQKRRGVL